MEAVSMSTLAGVGPAPANATSRTAKTGESLPGQAGSFGGMMRDILEPTAETGQASATPLQAQTGKLGHLVTSRGITLLPLPKLGKPLTGAGSNTPMFPVNTDLAACLVSASQPPLAQTAFNDIPPTQSKGSERAELVARHGSEPAASSEQVVSQPVLTMNLPPPLEVPGAVSSDPKKPGFVAIPDLETPTAAPSEFDTALTSHAQPASSSVDTPVVDIGGSPVLTGTAALEAGHLTSILQRVAQLEDNQPSATTSVAIASKPVPQTAPMLRSNAATRLVTDLPASPSLHSPILGPSLPKPIVHAGPTTNDSVRDQVHASPSRGNSQADAGPKDKSESEGIGNASQTRGSAEGKASSFLQTMSLVKDAPAAAPTAVAAHAIPVSGNAETKGDAENLSNLPAAPPNLPPAATHPQEFGRMVNDVQLAQSATHSEMRIAMQTDRLGNVELRAHVTGDEVGAAITVEKRDAHAALAAELPALQQALNEKHLRIDQLSLLQGSLHSTAGEAGAQQQPQERPRHVHTSASPVSGLQTLAAATGAVDHGMVFDSNGRLSVRA